MARTKQRGGNDAAAEQPPAQSGEEFAEVKIPDDFFVSGGGKKGKGKKAAAKPKPAAKKGKKGGALVEDIKNLAVPFAILLAKQGLEGMFKNKSAEKKSSMSASKATGTRRRSAAGGSCSSCAPVDSGVKGGSSKKSRYAKLSEEIDKFLNKY